MSKPLVDRDPFRLGLVALAGLAALGLLIGIVSIIPFGEKTYTAMFAQSANLRPKEDVQVSGVRVGEVRSVRIVGQAVQVQFTVKKSVKLGPQSTADIKVATLLGTHFLQVQPTGTGGLPHDQIPLSNTTVPFNLQDVLDGGVHKVEALDGPQLATMLSTMADTLGPGSKQLGPALTGVVRLSDVISSRGNDIGKLLAAARSVTQQLSGSSTDLMALMKQTNLVVGEVTARRQALHLLLVEATRLSRNLVGIIKDTQANITPALKSLDRALGELRRQDKQLRRVLEVMAPAARYVANSTGNGPWGLLYVNPPALPPNDGGCVLGGGAC